MGLNADLVQHFAELGDLDVHVRPNTRHCLELQLAVHESNVRFGDRDSYTKPSQ